MKARFMGDPRRNGEGPDVLHLYGVDFRKGEWVDPIPPALEAKLPGNSHFETASGDAVVAVKDVASLHVLGVGSTERHDFDVNSGKGFEPHPFQAFDHDGDGKPGGSTASPEKVALMAELDEMSVKYDRRLGPAKLRDLLEVAKFERGDD